MPKIVTLTQNRDFRRLYRKNNSLVSPALVVYYSNTHAGFSRLGITVSKKVGKAVKRNRAKRVIRVAYSSLLPKFNKDVDLVIVARVRATALSSDEITRQLETLLKKAQIID